MAASIQDLFSYAYLTEMTQRIKPGLPKVLPEELWTTKKQFIGDKVTIPIGQGARNLPQLSPYMSPAKAAGKYDLSLQSVAFMWFSEVMPFDKELMTVYRQWATYGVQDHRAMDLILYQTENFRKKFDNMRNAAVSSVLALDGKIYFDSSGNMLPTSSGASLTIDNLVPAGNSGNVNSIRTATWSSASTDIPTQVLNLKSYALKQTNYPLEYAFYGPNVAGYLHTNTSFTQYMARNNGYRDHYLNTGNIADGVLDLKWRPVQDFYFVDQNGTSQSVFRDDYITFTPDINKEVYTFFEGSTPVPSEINQINLGDIEALLKGAKEVYGIGSYAVANHNPIQLHQHMFDCFMPRLLVPEAFFFFDTTA